MMKSLLRPFMVAALLAATSVAAADVNLKAGHPDAYYVKKGDTLWDISNQFLDTPWQWPELWHVNQEIDNPHLIYPGDVIRLVYVEGKPQLHVEREQEVHKLQADGSVVKLSPQAREVDPNEAIAAVPMSNIRHFLREGLVLSAEEIKQAPYVLAGEDGRVVYGRGDTVYGRDTVRNWSPIASSYSVYRTGVRYIDPVTRKVLGYEARKVGMVSTSNQQDDLATFRIVESQEAIRAEDRILPAPAGRIRTVFHPSAPDQEITANVVHFFDRIDGVALNDVLVINKGTEDGVMEGNLLDAVEVGRKVKDPVTNRQVQLPNTVIGSVILFRVFDKVSYALVVRSEKPIRQDALFTNPYGSL